MTSRARLLVIAGLIGLFLGLIRGQQVLATLSLSLLIWILYSWIVFRLRIRRELRRIRFERFVNDRSEKTGVLWAGRIVCIRLQMHSSFGIEPILRIRDVIPDLLEFVDEENAPQQPENAASGASSQGEETKVINRRTRFLSFLIGLFAWQQESWSPNETELTERRTRHEWMYRALLRCAGELNLPGVRLTFSDWHGFFRTHRFVPVHQSFRVMPAYSDAGEIRPRVKRTNALPKHGIHRLQRSGMGSELLELREYVAGDPPKSIAWKVSARRDKLMTRQYESEVPVRVQLLIDGSISTRIGGFGKRLLDQLNFVAASVASACAAVGDPFTGVLIDEHGARRLQTFSGDQGFHRYLRALADFSINPPPIQQRMSTALLDHAVRIAYERFPDCMQHEYHQVPFRWLAWVPGGGSTFRTRFYLVGFLAERYGISPLEQVTLLHRDDSLAPYLQRFLSECDVPWTEPLISLTARDSFETSSRMELFNDAISKAVAHARDNEVFVLLADLLECGPYLTQLTKSIRLLKSRHHRIAFVLPSPNFSRPLRDARLQHGDQVSDLLRTAEEIQIRDLSEAWRRELRAIGVPLSLSGETHAIRMVLAEMDLARDGRRGPLGVRS